VQESDKGAGGGLSEPVRRENGGRLYHVGLKGEGEGGGMYHQAGPRGGGEQGVKGEDDQGTPVR